MGDDGGDGSESEEQDGEGYMDLSEVLQNGQFGLRQG